jgi:Zn-dependent M28 family amino/carboxypeptidase
VKCPPVFIIGQYDLPVLEDAVGKKTPVRLYAEVDFIPNTPSCNVVGTLPGKSADEVLCLAHLDTVYSSQGANDNTASVIVMLMLAHALKGAKLNKTMTFVATSGEEYNKLGAVNYANRREKEGTYDAIKYLINFDSVTWGPHIQIYSQDEGLKEVMHTIDKDLKLQGRPELIDSDGFELDGRPFRETGARAMYVGSTGYDNKIYCWHRPQDTPENVPLDAAEISFLLFHKFMKRLQDM